MTQNGTQDIPRWDLSSIYPGLDSKPLQQEMKSLLRMNDEIEEFIQVNAIKRGDGEPFESTVEDLAPIVEAYLQKINEALTLYYTLYAYAFLNVAVDSYNSEAKTKQSLIQAQQIRIEKSRSLFKGWLSRISHHLDKLPELSETIDSHHFYLRITEESSRFMLSDIEESLAQELSLSSILAWQKLQGTVSSQMKVKFERAGITELFPMPALQNIRRYDPDENVRRRAFECEIAAYEAAREPFASALNGVKGWIGTLNLKRGREDAVHESLDLYRIDRRTLEAMLEAMRASFPAFRKYLKTKAKRLGKGTLAWWDLFAPVGEVKKKFTFPEAREFIIRNFGTFSPELADFAQDTFEKNWIDAEPRDGKRGGAFCMSVPGREESRVLCNFDGTLDQTFTIAHELGHAYHVHCLEGKTYLQRFTPMTLAETASIFCETIVADAIKGQVSDPQEELALLETDLISDTQVILDITTRFQFEHEVFDRRADVELSADDFCEIMLTAQKDVYAEGLDEQHLHPYMWAWKPHYYYPKRSFYNYPYAFGLLFATGLYAIYTQQGSDFVPKYRLLLSRTGEARPADLASEFGFDINQPAFWRSSLEVIERRIGRYLEL